MRFMHGGVWRVCIIGCPWLALVALATIDLVGDNREF